MISNETIYRLQQDIEVPEIVTKKATETLEQIRMNSAANNKQVPYMKSKKNRKKRYAVIALAATLAIGTVTAYAAYAEWSKGLKEELRISEDSQNRLTENGMAAFSGTSVTDAGITVTAQQSITDNYYTYLSFRIDGYSVEQGVQPAFEYISVTVDGQEDFGLDAGFYDGLIPDENGRAIPADGSKSYANADGSINYVMDDGSLEYHMVLNKSDEKGFFIGKKLHVEFKNLGSAAKTDFTPDITGTWALDMTLGGADVSGYTETEQTLGDSGATVTSVELSPISARVTYDFPRIEETEEYKDENGNLRTHTYYKDAPTVSGVKLKDGTTIMNLYNGGTEGYSSENSNEYISTFTFNRVIDSDQVASVLFRKTTENSGNEAAEPEYYEVALN